MPRYKVEVHVPCVAFAEVEAESPEEAVKKVQEGACDWPEGDVPKPDWKGAEPTRAVNMETQEVYEVEF